MLTKMFTNIKTAWRGFKNMSNLSKPSNSDIYRLDVTEQRKLADELNVFNTRFDNPELPTIQLDPELPPVPIAEQMMITVEEVREQLLTCDLSKAPGRDGLTTQVSKSCYFELSQIFCDIFHLCFRNGKLPILWKLSAVKPLP